MAQVVLMYLKMFLAFCNIIILMYGLYKFLGKPRFDLEERVRGLEKRVYDLENAEKRDNKKFDHLAKGLEVITRGVVALIDFEAASCLTGQKEFSDGLKESKAELNKYLSDIRRGFDDV